MTVPAPQSHTPRLSFERERGIYAVQVTPDIAHVRVPLPDDVMRSQRTLRVFRTLAEGRIPLFLIKLHRTSVTFGMMGDDLDLAVEMLNGAGFETQTRGDLAILMLIAANMRDIPNVMVSIGDAIYAAGATLFETGDSHDSVQCLIEAAHVPAAVRSLCEAFHLDDTCVQETRLELD